MCEEENAVYIDIIIGHELKKQTRAHATVHRSILEKKGGGCPKYQKFRTGLWEVHFSRIQNTQPHDTKNLFKKWGVVALGQEILLAHSFQKSCNLFGTKDHAQKQQF